MFINIGGRYIRTENIRVIDEEKKTVHDYQGFTHVVTADMDDVVKKIVDAEKSSTGLALAAVPSIL